MIMKKIRFSNTENCAIKHLCIKPKPQFSSLKALYMVKNTTEFVGAEGLAKHLRRYNRATQGLRKKKGVELKHQGFIEV